MSEYKYTPKEIAKMKSGDIRKEYSRLRSIANKRVMRKWKAGLSGTDYPGDQLFPSIKQISGFSGEYAVEYMKSMLAEVSRFLQNPMSTLTGTRKHIKHIRAVLSDMGYGELVDTDEKFMKFTKFMDAMREVYGDLLFDSGDALDVLQQTERLNIPIERVADYYEEFLTNLEALENMPTPRTSKTISERKLKSIINKFS